MRLNQGDKMPDFTYTTPYREGRPLSEGLGGRRTLLLFLRYYGCPICQLDMLALKDEYARIEATGGQVKVVLQSDPGKLAERLEGESFFPFEIICDPAQELYRLLEIKPARSTLGLAGAATIKKLGAVRKRGLSHGEYEGEELQLPAAFLIEPDLTVSYAHYGKSAGDVPDAAQIAALLGA